MFEKVVELALVDEIDDVTAKWSLVPPNPFNSTLFPWTESVHPLLNHSIENVDGSTTFKTRVSGDLFDLMENHQVSDQICKIKLLGT